VELGTLIISADACTSLQTYFLFPTIKILKSGVFRCMSYFIWSALINRMYLRPCYSHRFKYKFGPWRRIHKTNLITVVQLLPPCMTHHCVKWLETAEITSVHCWNSSNKIIYFHIALWCPLGNESARAPLQDGRSGPCPSPFLLSSSCHISQHRASG